MVKEYRIVYCRAMLHTQITTTTHIQLNLTTPQSSASKAIRLVQFPALKPALSQDNNPNPHKELMIWSNIAASALSARRLQVQNTYSAQACPLHSLSRPIFVPPFINSQKILDKPILSSTSRAGQADFQCANFDDAV
jgi:hypothetical protein